LFTAKKIKQHLPYGIEGVKITIYPYFVFFPGTEWHHTIWKWKNRSSSNSKPKKLYLSVDSKPKRFIKVSTFAL
jgi:hypothetical protein